jgi:hypothetical protein
VQSGTHSMKDPDSQAHVANARFQSKLPNSTMAYCQGEEWYRSLSEFPVRLCR